MKENNFQIFVGFVTQDLSKKFSQFGPAVWPAIANISMYQ